MRKANVLLPMLFAISWLAEAQEKRHIEMSHLVDTLCGRCYNTMKEETMMAFHSQTAPLSHNAFSVPSFELERGRYAYSFIIDPSYRDDIFVYKVSYTLVATILPIVRPSPSQELQSPPFSLPDSSEDFLLEDLEDLFVMESVLEDELYR